MERLRAWAGESRSGPDPRTPISLTSPTQLCSAFRICSGVEWAVLRWPEEHGIPASGSKQEAQEIAADPPRFPSKSGRSGRFGRTVCPRSAGQTGADRADGPSEAAQRVGGSHPFGWRLRGTRVIPGALMISLGRVRASAGAAASVPLRGTRRDDLWRDRAGFRSGSLNPVRPSSGNIGPDRGAEGAVGCVGDLVRARRGGSKEAGRVRPAWVQRRAGSGEGGGRGDFRSPRVPSGPGGPPASGLVGMLPRNGLYVVAFGDFRGVAPNWISKRLFRSFGSFPAWQ